MWPRSNRSETPGIEHLTQLIGTLLHEPHQRARCIAISHLEDRARAHAQWQALAACEPGQAAALAGEVRADGLDEVASFINRSDRGIVLTTLHGGDYLLALLRLHLALDDRRKILIVRRKAPSALETAVFRLFGKSAPVEVVRHSERRALRLVRALRRGHLVVALYDLPASFGPTHEVSLLSQPMHLVRGPAELALLGNADLVPLVSWRHQQKPCLACLPPIRPVGVESTCRQLARMATDYIQVYPAQWQHWFHVPEMINPGASRP